MNPREFVDTRTKRYMAQALEEFEERVEQPLQALAVTDPRARAILADLPTVKRTFRRKLQTLASDCLDLMPSDVEINAVELIRSSA